MKTIVKIKTSRISSNKFEVIIKFISTDTEKVIKEFTFITHPNPLRKVHKIKLDTLTFYDDEITAEDYFEKVYFNGIPLNKKLNIVKRYFINDGYKDEDCTIKMELPGILEKTDDKFYKLKSIEFVRGKNPNYSKSFDIDEIGRNIADYCYEKSIAINKRCINNLKDKFMKIIDKHVNYWKEIRSIKGIKFTYDVIKYNIEYYFDIDKSLQQILNEFNIDSTQSPKYIAECIAEKLGYKILAYI